MIKITDGGTGARIQYSSNVSVLKLDILTLVRQILNLHVVCIVFYIIIFHS